MLATTGSTKYISCWYTMCACIFAKFGALSSMNGSVPCAMNNLAIVVPRETPVHTRTVIFECAALADEIAE